jgi:PKD domain
VTIFARSLSLLSYARSATGRRRIRAAALAAGVAATLIVIAAPAQAVVVTAGSNKVGLQPRNGTTQGTPGAEPLTFSNESGNVVLHGTSDYAVYWDPNKPTEFTHEWITDLDGFFQALGEARFATPFAVLGQYRDRSNVSAPFQALSKGAYSDTAKFPPGKCTDPKNPATTCLTDAQLREQLQSFITGHGLPTGMGAVYYLLTPPGVTVCLDEAASRCSDYSRTKSEETKGEHNSASYKESFCSYHGDINLDNAAAGDASTILYAAIPWIAYTTSFDCQDGGWNPEKGKEVREAPPELPKKEEEAREKAFEELPAKKKEEAEEARRLEGPHIEEPNQEGKGEGGSYSAGLADLLVNQIAEEEMNIVTDPLLTSWHDGKGNEATDMCRNVFAATSGENGSRGEVAGSVQVQEGTAAGTLSNVSLGTGRYYVNNVFSLSDGGCSGGLGLIARFTAPNPVNVNEIVGVDGMESTISLGSTDAFGPSGLPTLTYASFSWNFGDGTSEVTGFAPGAPACETPWLSPCAASAFHSYQYGGTYNVTLTITDVAGNKTHVSHVITVNGSPAPVPAPASSGAPAGSSTQSGAPSAAKGPTANTVSAPLAAAAIAKQPLHKALRKGLVVDYSVNEQVAGHFEVLLSSATARRLGITGTAAAGLPAGSPAELVIAKAILVTTKGGKSAVHIQFSKHTAARLAHAHTVSLMLRLIVRNAATSNPLTTTVVSTITLSA